MNCADSTLSIPIAFLPEDEEMRSAAARLLATARVAQGHWAKIPLRRRLARVRKLRHLIAAHARELAEASATARQRPIVESLTAEVLPLAQACQFLERNALSVLTPKCHGFRGRPAWLTGVYSEVHREPFGVVLVIGPGNYPLFLPGVQTIQALVAGNAVLLKPGLGGTAVAKLFRELIVFASFDPALLTVLPETTDAARAAIDAGPDKVIFTGSAATGEAILAQLARQLVPAVMELSGCDAVLVRSDADLDLTTKALAFALRLNNGATCLAPKRVFVHHRLATELEGRLAEEFNRCSARRPEREPGEQNPNGLRSSTLERLRPLIQNALSLGAHFVAGGIGQDGSLEWPIILAGVSPEARLLPEDIFAPVLALVTVADDDEAVLRINRCPFALGASIFTRAPIRARELAVRIGAGNVSINDLIVPTADARLPFGGCKRSGFGTTRGAEGLLELTRPKVITLTRGRLRPAFDPPAAGDSALIENYLQAVHGVQWKQRLRACGSLVRNLFRRYSLHPSNTHERLS